MKQIKNSEVFKSSFTLSGFFFSIAIAYSALILANFIIEVYLFFYYPSFHIYTDPEPAQTVVEAMENAKDETIQVVSRHPIQFTVVAVLCGIGVFIILYGPWEY